MRVFRFNESTKEMKLMPHSFDDLYLLARLLASGDRVTGKGYRRFRPSEGEKGEQKEVVVGVILEKVELDRNTQKLRLGGKIFGGKPIEFLRLGSYHTLSVGVDEDLTIVKEEWSGYMLQMIRKAVADSKKPRLGAVAMDDEKATLAYVRGSGIEIVTEIYSKLSKKMKETDYEKSRRQYFSEIVKKINSMPLEIIVVAGPGFMKDELKKFIETGGAKLEKRVVYTRASDAERSGLREALQSEAVANIFENERLKKEFSLLNIFLRGMASGFSIHGLRNVAEALAEYRIATVLVNDSLLNDTGVRPVLDLADRNKVAIEIFNADDDAGIQLKGFGGIGAIVKGAVK